MKFIKLLILTVALGFSNDLSASEKYLDIQLDNSEIARCVVTESQNCSEYISDVQRKEGEQIYQKLCFSVIPDAKVLYLEALYSNGPGKGTAFMNFIMNIAVKEKMMKIELSSEFGSWGFYYKLGFRPRMFDLYEENSRRFGSYGVSYGEPETPFKIDYKISLAMAINLGCVSEAVLLKKNKMLQNLVEAETYFADNYLQNNDTYKHIKRELKRAYWNKKAPRRSAARTLGHGDVIMVMNAASIQRFAEIQALNPGSLKAIRLLGDEAWGKDTHDEFLSAEIPDPKELIDHLTDIYGIPSVKK